jgi:hypothetical protein
MTFRNDYSVLRSCFDLERERVELPNSHISILSSWFDSDAVALLPGASRYRCDAHAEAFRDGSYSESPSTTDEASMRLPDTAVLENQRFRIVVFVDSRRTSHRGAVLMLHGLNERTWHKYLPWAQRLVETTGKAVILFPIAFHMNRAPSAWSHPRLMRRMSQRRQAQSTTILNSTLDELCRRQPGSGAPQLN